MLTDSLCKSATCPSDKPHKRFFDSGGMYLEVTLAGGKYWRLKYRLANINEHLIHHTPALPTANGPKKTMQSIGSIGRWSKTAWLGPTIP